MTSVYLYLPVVAMVDDDDDDDAAAAAADNDNFRTPSGRE